MVLKILLVLSEISLSLNAISNSSNYESGRKSASVKAKDNVAVQLSPAEIEAYQGVLPLIAESEGKPMAWAVPVIPYELSFEWGIQSHQVSPIYVETFGRLLVDQTPVYQRLIGIAEFSHILDMAMDPQNIHQIRGMSPDELRLLADTDIMRFLVEKGLPGGEEFLANNLRRIEFGSENTDPKLAPEALLPRDLLIEYLEEKKAAILRKHFEEKPYYRPESMRKMR